MRILYLLQNFPYPPDDGVRIKVFELLRCMQERHQCDILSFCDVSDAKVMDFRRAVPHCRIIALFPLQVGHRLQILRAKNLLRGRPVFLARWQSEAFRHAAENAVTQGHYDLVHMDALGMAPYLSLCRNVPTVISTTDAVSLSQHRAAACTANPVKRGYRAAMANLTGRLERVVLPQATKVHVVSSVDAEYLRAHVPGIDVCHIELAVGDDYLHYELVSSHDRRHEDTFEVLFTGLLTVGGIAAGLRTFVDQAWPIVLSAIPGASLTILGRGASDGLRRHLADAPKVRIVEWVDDYKSALTKADAVVFPDQAGTGIKTRVLYAMALGCPVIGSPLALEGIGATDGEHCLRCQRPVEFAQSLIEIWKQPALGMRIGSSARAMIRERFNTVAIGQRWINLYEQARTSH